MGNSAAQYERFVVLVKELADVSHAQDLLGWDQEVNMPAKGVNPRARALGTLAGIRHDRLTAPELVDLVTALSEAGLQGDQAVNLRELKRSQQRAQRIPKALIVEMTQTESLSHEAWVEARKTDNFATFQPWLEKVFELKRQIAESVGYTGSIYNALFDEYEPYAQVEEVEPVLADLRQRLVPLVAGIRDSGHVADDLLSRTFDVTAQQTFGRQVMTDLGFDLQAGRLDVAVHPFCSGTSPSDVRLTTRYSPAQMQTSLFGIIHETGHGLYEQGLPDSEGMPVGGAISLGIHESQSRMWENLVGRSREYWQHYLPVLGEHFPEQLAGVDVDRFYAAANQVAASLIRVEADEVTYNLHILLRFELEKALIEGELSVQDLPGEWNDRMEKYVGIRPDSDADGVLQDIHWSVGLIGYFATYSLGNLYAAQFYRQASADLTDLPQQIASGEFSGLLGWLRSNIHAVGKRRTAAELVQDVTGEPLKVEYLMDYLEGKFKPLYGLD
jgi:carboxypeptidase Taq